MKVYVPKVDLPLNRVTIRHREAALYMRGLPLLCYFRAHDARFLPIIVKLEDGREVSLQEYYEMNPNSALLRG